MTPAELRTHAKTLEARAKACATKGSSVVVSPEMAHEIALALRTYADTLDGLTPIQEVQDAVRRATRKHPEAQLFKP